ncbi:MAG: hypothetical protein JWM21_296 [Acidobacteria bacterium]|nr:hypothetical protein [Acidobacteriota bacterium]
MLPLNLEGPAPKLAFSIVERKPYLADDDGIAIMISLGFLAVVGIGALVVLKAIAKYEPDEIITEPQAAQLASSYASTYEPSPNCKIHGEDAQLCQSCHGCMECIGRDDNQYCKRCYYD